MAAPTTRRRGPSNRSLLRQSQSLREVIEEISSELEQRPLLTSIVRHACELLGAHDGSIGLYDEGKDVIRIAAIYRMPESEIGAELPAGVGLAGLVLETRRPVVLARYGQVPQPILPELADNTVLGMPIVWRDRMIGFFGIGARPPRRFGDDDAERLELFARHAAIAIENARLYERARQVAVLEERARLARDLHDSVAQKLFSISLFAQSMDAAWRRDPAEGERRTARLVQLSGEALTEMRALLRELRPPEADAESERPVAPVLERPGLVPALERLIHEGARDGLKVELVLRGYADPAAGPVPPELEDHLLRIAQEALANVAKHARASEATILLAREGSRIVLKVVDDGVGFDATHLPRRERRGREGGGLGLAGIRERAAAFGGRMRVGRRPGGGTLLQVVVYSEGGGKR